MSAPPSFPHALPARNPGVAWADRGREAAFCRWLERIAPAHGLVPASLRLASADASFRRYLRIDVAVPPENSTGAKRAATRVIMDAPADKEDCRPFVGVAGLMADAGLLVPRILEWEQAQGFLLLDDLGSQTMMDAVVAADAAANQPLYLRAVDALVAWQLASKPEVLPLYDGGLLARELSLFPDWYLQRHRGLKVEGSLRSGLDDMFKLIIERNLAAASVFVHRDFMPRNLMMPGDPAEPRLGVLDFQDAVYGPISYDIASLMRDAFLTWDEEFVLDITVRYWQKARRAGLPVDSDFGDFYRAVEWMGLQRHLKVAGIFARLALRDGKAKYLADTPRFIAYIRAAASRYRELTPLLRLIDEAEGTVAVSGYAFGRI
jgi:aminoglycoside/choline kinase family phosphotransferase